jgi:DNA-binding transcriptional LysR family regulator
MNLRTIDLNLLPVFDAVYSERNLTRAAETLNATQPAVSMALRRLRTALGDPLFVRAGQGVVPTRAAEVLIGPVREGLARIRSGLDERRHFVPAQSTRAFNIAAGNAAVCILAPALASRLAGVAPSLRFYFRRVDRDAIPGELAAGHLDLAVDIPALDRPELESVALRQDPYVCFLRHGHPALKRKLDLDALMRLRHIAVSSRRSGRNVVDMALHRKGLRLHPCMRFTNYDPAFAVVMASDHVLIAPRSLAGSHAVQSRPLPLNAPLLELRLFWRREHGNEPGSRWVREQLLACVAHLA